jgi:hypothetical protein
VRNLFFYTLLQGLLLQSLSLQADSYLATYSRRFTAYASGPSNDFVGRLGYDEMADPKHPADFVKRDQAASFLFQCPGDSFLVGTQALYSEMDLQFFFICRFLEDPKGNLIQAGASTDTSEWEQLRGGDFGLYSNYTAYDNGFANAGTSVCKSTEALGGAISRYVDQIESGTPPIHHADRKWKHICREMKGIDGAVLTKKTDSCQNFLQQETGNFTFTCPVDTVVAKMSSTFNIATELRRYTFTCCKYGT